MNEIIKALEALNGPCADFLLPLNLAGIGLLLLALLVPLTRLSGSRKPWRIGSPTPQAVTRLESGISLRFVHAPDKAALKAATLCLAEWTAPAPPRDTRLPLELAAGSWNFDYRQLLRPAAHRRRSWN